MTAEPLALEEAACPGCGARSHTLVYEAGDAIYHVDPRAFPLRRCTACELVYLGRRPRPEAIAAAYPPSYFWRQAYTTPEPGAGLDRRFGARYFRQLYERRACFAERRLGPGPLRMLDLGCGGGHFLAAVAARRAGTFVGVDFEVGEPPPGIRLYAGDLQALALAEGEFDWVSFWHVLEHLHAPRRALAEAYARLRPGGTLLVATQNFDALSRVLMGPAWPLNDVPRHLCHFTPATLGPLVEAAGFSGVRVHPWTEYFPVLGGHLFPRATVLPDGSLRALPGLALCAALAPVEVAAIALGRGCTFNLTARK